LHKNFQTYLKKYSKLKIKLLLKICVKFIFVKQKKRKINLFFETTGYFFYFLEINRNSLEIYNKIITYLKINQEYLS